MLVSLNITLKGCVMELSFWDTWSRQEINALFEKLYQKSAANIPTAKNTPQAVFLDGLKGVGKSSFARAFLKDNPDFILLSVDNLLKDSPDYQPQNLRLNDKYAPDNLYFADLMDFGVYASRHIVFRAMQERKNILTDGLSGNLLHDAVQTLKSGGYEVRGKVLAAPKRLLDLNILTRLIAAHETFPETMIATNLRQSRFAVDTVLRNFETFSRYDVPVQMLSAGGKKILSEKNVSAKEFEQEFYRPLSSEENQELVQRQKFLKQKISLLPLTEKQKRFYIHAVNACAQPFLPDGRHR